MSVSRDVLEGVEASQICICNVNEDTVGWAQEAASLPGIYVTICLHTVGGSVVYMRPLAACHSKLGELLYHPKPQKRKLRRDKTILRKQIKSNFISNYIYWRVLKYFFNVSGGGWDIYFVLLSSTFVICFSSNLSY